MSVVEDILGLVAGSEVPRVSCVLVRLIPAYFQKRPIQLCITLAYAKMALWPPGGGSFFSLVFTENINIVFLINEWRRVIG